MHSKKPISAEEALAIARASSIGPDVTTRDLSNKAADDVVAALLRNIDLGSQEGAASFISISAMHAMIAACSMLLTAAYEGDTSGKPPAPRVTSHAEQLHWMLTILRLKFVGGLALEAHLVAAADVSLLLAHGFPAEGKSKCTCSRCREGRPHGGA